MSMMPGIDDKAQHKLDHEMDRAITDISWENTRKHLFYAGPPALSPAHRALSAAIYDGVRWPASITAIRAIKNSLWER